MSRHGELPNFFDPAIHRIGRDQIPLVLGRVGFDAIEMTFRAVANDRARGAGGTGFGEQARCVVDGQCVERRCVAGFGCRWWNGITSVCLFQQI